ncbi:hypothetical protein ABZS66_12105 [Dactylosporangium sp. NPDC005572]|uniref:hypothetical protein n=1 Tax=Dactylosporangium sp. NPDC005572 TaxID=3156889 RepID=UPI0033BDD136
MKVSGVRTTADTPVTLLFVETGVHIIDHSTYRGRLLRSSGGAVLAAFGLGAIGLGVGHAVSPGLGIALTVFALVLTVVAGVVGAVVWVLDLRAEYAMRHNATVPAIAVDAVRWANSKLDHGRVEVTVGMADGTVHTFHAVGMAGQELARRFAQFLAVKGSPDAEAVPDSGDRAAAATSAQPDSQ